MLKSTTVSNMVLDQLVELKGFLFIHVSNPKRVLGVRQVYWGKLKSHIRLLIKV